MTLATEYRYREDGPFSAEKRVEGTMNPVGSDSYALVYGPYQYFYSYKQMGDWVTKPYQKLISKGAIINNPCSFEKTERNESDGTVTGVHTNGSYYEYSGPVTSKWLADMVLAGTLTDRAAGNQVDPPVMIAIAKQRALANIDSSTYGFAEDIAEIRDTLGFIRNPLGGILKETRALRRSLPSHRPLSQIPADAWLSYRFVITPSLKSIFDALEAVSRLLPKLPERQVAHGFIVDSGEVAKTISGTSLFSQLVFEDSYQWNVHYKGSILYEVRNPINDWKRLLGLRLKDIPVTAWNIVTLSFMVDRFLDISKAIQGLVNLADPSIQILAGSVTVRDEVIQKIALVDKIELPPSDWTSTAVGGTREDLAYSYRRTTWKPTVADVMPRLRLGGLVSDATKIADLVALTLNVLK